MATQTIEIREDGVVVGTQTITTPDFKTLTGSQFLSVAASAVGFSRVDQLMEKSPTVAALIQQAKTVDRYSGNTPAAIAYLKTGANAMTDSELEAIENAWKAIS